MEYSPSWKNQQTDFLVQAWLSLENPSEVYRLLEDLCTINEIKSMAQRLEVARLLEKNTKYNEIAQDTGASTATISRVKRCLYYGAGGYRLILEKNDKEQKNEE